MKKYLAVVVILLFIGLAVAPSINANVSKEGLVEFTTEVCGLDGGKQTVKLTQEEAEEVEALFESIRRRLNATESREEAEEIFKEAVVELDKYGLLGGLSVKQVQNLITDNNQNQRVKEYLSEITYKYQIDEPDLYNKNCIVAGRATRTFFLTIDNILTYFIFFLILLTIARINWDLYRLIIRNYLENNYPDLAYKIESLFFSLVFAIAYAGTYLSPIELVGFIAFGTRGAPGPEDNPASGWIYTNGLNGTIEYNGSFIGYDANLIFCFGSYLFKGIRIGSMATPLFFLGHAYVVGINYWEDRESAYFI